jgi:hypothetical protein
MTLTATCPLVFQPAGDPPKSISAWGLRYSPPASF